MDTLALVGQYQEHLVDALVARITATEAAVGNVFDFDIMRHGKTTLVMAHQWPHPADHVPFDRMYNYTLPEAEPTASMLQYCVTAHIDAIVEIGAEPQQRQAEQLLRQYEFTPQWTIPWLHLDLAQFTLRSYQQIDVRKLGLQDMDASATLFIQGYGYHGTSADAWHTFAKHGYTAPGFHCFVAKVAHEPIGFGVLHVKGTTALVDGAATVPQFRGLGAQKALLTARIQYARELGCTHAFSRTGAGSISQRNMEKVGLRTVYQTTAWRRHI